MPKEYLNPATLFASVSHGFTQVIVASGAKAVFVSGQVAWDRDRQIVGQTLGEQAQQALRNVQAAVEAAGGTLSDIVALRIYIIETQRQHIGEVGEALRQAFEINSPTSSWIGVAFLASPEFLIEIEATAVLD